MDGVRPVTNDLVSIHVPLAEHDLPGGCLTPSVGVSIHVPLAEHDISQVKLLPKIKVSIHVPLAEHDFCNARYCLGGFGFNSRAPRGARRYSVSKEDHMTSFNSRAPRGARRDICPLVMPP